MNNFEVIYIYIYLMIWSEVMAMVVLNHFMNKQKKREQLLHLKRFRIL